MQTTLYKPLTAFLCCLLLSLPLPSRAQDISIKYASGRSRDTSYVVDINMKLRLDEKIINALQHGVSLEFVTEVQIRRERKWLWDKLIKEAKLHYQLEHHPLSNDYVVTNLDTDIREQFQTLPEALNYLGTIREYPLIESDRLSKDRNYTGYVKAELNIEELPAPLKPIAYVSSQWHLESQWYEWIIR